MKETAKVAINILVLEYRCHLVQNFVTGRQHLTWIFLSFWIQMEILSHIVKPDLSLREILLKSRTVVSFIPSMYVTFHSMESHH